jgi:hypothetical protein
MRCRQARCRPDGERRARGRPSRAAEHLETDDVTFGVERDELRGELSGPEESLDEAQ